MRSRSSMKSFIPFLYMKTIPCKWNRWKCSSPISHNVINIQKFSFNKSESRWHLEQSFQTANWFLLPWERNHFRVISKKEDWLSTTERRRVDREFLPFVALNSLFKLMIYNLRPNFLQQVFFLFFINCENWVFSLNNNCSQWTKLLSTTLLLSFKEIRSSLIKLLECDSLINIFFRLHLKIFRWQP